MSLHDDIRAFSSGLVGYSSSFCVRAFCAVHRNRHFSDNPTDAELLHRFEELRAKPVAEWDSDDFQLEAFAIEYDNDRLLAEWLNRRSSK